MPRRIKISVRLSAEEHAYLKQQSANAGLKMEPFVRRLIMGKEIRPRPPDTYAALLRELSAIGSNLNQIARVANTTREATPEQLVQAQALVAAAWKLLKEGV